MNRKAVKTSLSMQGDLLKKAKEMQKKKGIRSFSEYLQLLAKEDLAKAKNN